MFFLATFIGENKGSYSSMRLVRAVKLRRTRAHSGVLCTSVFIVMFIVMCYAQMWVLCLNLINSGFQFLSRSFYCCNQLTKNR